MSWRNLGGAGFLYKNNFYKLLITLFTLMLTMKKSRIFLWIILLSLAGTGIALHFLAGTADELPHPLNGLFRSLHGAASFLALFIFGFFFSDHVQKKWTKYKYKWRTNLLDAYSHFTVWTLLIFSGLLLYYPQDLLESLGINVGNLHWYLGIGLLFLFPLHFWRKSMTRFYARKQWEKSLAVKEKSNTNNVG